MTKQWYQDHGFELSSLISDKKIEQAEADVTLAYIKPIVGTTTVPQEVRERALGNLAFLLILQRSIFATRAGAKTKTGYNSADADAWSLLQQEAHSCHLALETLRAQEGCNADAEVVDICKIYFKTNFVSL